MRTMLQAMLLSLCLFAGTNVRSRGPDRRFTGSSSPCRREVVPRLARLPQIARRQVCTKPSSPCPEGNPAPP
jgi:hypothetical protein